MPDKFDEVASNLDDLAIDVDELEDTAADIDATKLEKIKEGLDIAKDAIDDIAEEQG